MHTSPPQHDPDRRSNFLRGSNWILLISMIGILALAAFSISGIQHGFIPPPLGQIDVGPITINAVVILQLTPQSLAAQEAFWKCSRDPLRYCMDPGVVMVQAETYVVDITVNALGQMRHATLLSIRLPTPPYSCENRPHPLQAMPSAPLCTPMSRLP